MIAGIRCGGRFQYGHFPRSVACPIWCTNSYFSQKGLIEGVYQSLVIYFATCRTANMQTMFVSVFLSSMSCFEKFQNRSSTSLILPNLHRCYPSIGLLVMDVKVAVYAIVRCEASLYPYSQCPLASERLWLQRCTPVLAEIAWGVRAEQGPGQLPGVGSAKKPSTIPRSCARAKTPYSCNSWVESSTNCAVLPSIGLGGIGDILDSILRTRHPQLLSGDKHFVS